MPVIEDTPTGTCKGCGDYKSLYFNGRCILCGPKVVDANILESLR